MEKLPVMIVVSLLPETFLHLIVMGSIFPLLMDD
jgi:hypothetical protein